jgi:hypothetical protein
MKSCGACKLEDIWESDDCILPTETKNVRPSGSGILVLWCPHREYNFVSQNYESRASRGHVRSSTSTPSFLRLLEPSVLIPVGT